MAHDREPFAWDEESTLFETVRSVAVYENPKGDICIRQEATDYVDLGDPVIIIPRERVPQLIERLQFLTRPPE